MPPSHHHPLLHALAPYAAWLLTLASIVSWRRGVYFAGGADPVVVLKAVVGVAALAVAACSFYFRKAKIRSGARSIVLLCAFVAVSLLGAIADGNFAASAVLSVRVLLIAATVMFLVSAFPPRVLINSLLAMMSVVGLVAAGSGIGAFAAEGRIFGVIPPLNPNDISLLCGLPALGLVHELSLGTAKNRFGVPLLAVLMTVVWFTGSRTGLFAFATAAALILLHARRLRIGAAIAVFALVPVTFYVLTSTDLFTKVLQRGDDTGANLLTLNARTIAWHAVLNTPSDTWQRWVGAGLAVKQVAVAGQYWQDQVLDSSWISALAQAGVVGTALLAVWALGTLFSSAASRPIRSFTTPALVFILIRSFLENGLVDSNVPFVVFLTISFLVERSAGEEMGVNRHVWTSALPGSEVSSARSFAQDGGYPRR